VRDDLGVHVGGEAVAERLELGAQLFGVLDDAVVDDGDVCPAVVMGVRIGLGDGAVRGPPRVPDAAARPGR
jgi:hypothetical protein